MPSPIVAAIVVGLLPLILVFILERRQPSYPPGPKGLPFLGAAKEHPRTEFWKTYRDWGVKYGECFLAQSLSNRCGGLSLTMLFGCLPAMIS